MNARGSRFLQNVDLYHHTTGCHIAEYNIIQSPVLEPNILHIHIRGAPKTPDGPETKYFKAKWKNFINTSRYIPCPQEFEYYTL